MEMKSVPSRDICPPMFIQHYLQYLRYGKKNPFETTYNTGEPGGHQAKGDKPDTERQIPRNLTYTQNQIKSNIQKQRVELWL